MANYNSGFFVKYSCGCIGIPHSTIGGKVLLFYTCRVEGVEGYGCRSRYIDGFDFRPLDFREDEALRLKLDTLLHGAISPA